LRGALRKETAINLPENRTTEQLEEAEQIEKTESGYYLTDIGKIVAMGALEIYPELKEGR
jgi:predicted transcriptional regulator